MTLSRRNGPSASRAENIIALAALAATMMLIQGDQSALAQAVQGMERSFGLSDQVVGLIPLIMAASASLGAIPAGILADRRRRTFVLAGLCAVWALGMGAGVIADTFILFIVARLVTGAAEGTPPVAISLLSDYFPVRRRSGAMGIYQAGAIAGAIIGLFGGGIAVQIGGWDWAFWIWVPIGLLVAVGYLFVHEPPRGQQDAKFGQELDERAARARARADGSESAVALGAPEAGSLAEHGSFALPPPRHDPPPEQGMSMGSALRYLMRIPSMWFGTLSLTVSQLLLYGLSFWGVEYFERVHHLGPALAGALTAVLGAGSAIGILAGGFLSDRLLRQGHVNARVYVVAYGSIGATLVLAPAFASTDLMVSAPLIFIGGIFLTLPVAPAEALLTDVVPAELRGRGATVRQFIRTASYAGPLIIGLISDAIARHHGASSAPSTIGLHWAIVAVCPLYALGGLIMFAAVRSYPRDISTVVWQAHARMNGVPVPDPDAEIVLERDPAAGHAPAPVVPPAVPEVVLQEPEPREPVPGVPHKTGPEGEGTAGPGAHEPR